MPAPRRVTVLIDSLIPGGAERVAVDAAAYLDPDRYVAHLLVTRHSGSLEARVRELGLAFTVLDRRHGFHPRLFARATSIVRGSALLHAHKLAGSAWGALLARAARRPLVSHEHIADGGPAVLRAAVYRILVSPSSRRIICVSSAVAESLRAHGVPPERLEVVPNGVPVQGVMDRPAARAELGLDAEASVIGMVARLRPQKRHDLALEALAELRRRGRDVSLCIVGDGPEAGALRQLAGVLSVEDRVIWAGERADAGRLMRAFDASLLTSWYEGMPLAVLEALVAGVPVVSTDLPVMRELLADGAGTIVARADASAVADAIVATIDAGAPAASVEAARARFRIERLARDLERIYDEVVQGGE